MFMRKQPENRLVRIEVEQQPANEEGNMSDQDEDDQTLQQVVVQEEAQETVEHEEAKEQTIEV
jgi:hypothetical protein